MVTGSAGGPSSIGGSPMSTFGTTPAAMSGLCGAGEALKANAACLGVDAALAFALDLDFLVIGTFAIFFGAMVHCQETPRPLPGQSISHVFLGQNNLLGLS